MFAGRKTIIVISLFALVVGSFALGVTLSFRDPLSVPLYEISTGKGEISFMQISDLHNHSDEYGDGNTISGLLEENHPDYLFLTGDLMDSHTTGFDYMVPILEKANELKIPMYYVHGNHEMAEPDMLPRLEEFLDGYGAVNMTNTTVKLNEGYTLTGIGDPTIELGTDFEAIVKDEIESVKGNYDDSTYNIVLCHQPRFSLFLSNAGFDLALSGHTHGGQGELMGKALFSSSDYFHGLYERGDFKHVVSAGAGYSYRLPVRFFQDSEVPLYKLV